LLKAAAAEVLPDAPERAVPVQPLSDAPERAVPVQPLSELQAQVVAAALAEESREPAAWVAVPPIAGLAPVLPVWEARLREPAVPRWSSLPAPRASSRPPAEAPDESEPLVADG
jgi:hypothetical protein